ncbi:protein CBFA2T1 [Rhopalosiphum padi]|uniref:protein CBFA2T1 n=1 Tax=Rhopalosiphum padi TaxID=40932 RepID=UPI00298D881D|nr:protein CBFA2T1 [Rhopalosiphum padi]
MYQNYRDTMRASGFQRFDLFAMDNNCSNARRQLMEPKMIKEEAIERDSGILTDETAINNNNNKESAFRIHIRKSKIKSKDAGFSSTSTSDSSGEHLLSPTHPLPTRIDVESESSSPPSDTFRNHSKLKRFLTTLVQFSGQISPQTSERVKGQIFTLVNNLISVEEFHHNIQEMTNFPLRPFVLPFLRTHLPSLQRDLLLMARNNKQTLSQYLKQHENAYLDRDSQATEPSEIFHQVERVPPPSPMPRENNNTNGNNNNSNSSSNNNGIIGNGHKRPYPLADSYYETGGYAADLEYQQPCVKRPNLGYAIPFMYHHPHLHPQEPPPPPPLPPPPSHPYNILPLLHIREAEDHKGHVEDEWKNIHVMLNCILSMVEKTKKALGILQERGMTETSFPDWNRKKSTEEILAQTVRHTEERIEIIKKKAEDSMNEIRHQAMIELQKLVLAAENKMIELVATERTKMSNNCRNSSTASLQISPSLISQYNSCWNCGRKANETCSGCNTAQYCSSFCQHKDWETHHQTCCVHSAAAATATTTVDAASSPGKKQQQPPPPPSSSTTTASSSSTADDLSTNRAQSTAAATPSLSSSSLLKTDEYASQQSSVATVTATATTTTVTTTTTTSTATTTTAVSSKQQQQQ